MYTVPPQHGNRHTSECNQTTNETIRGARTASYAPNSRDHLNSATRDDYILQAIRRRRRRRCIGEGVLCCFCATVGQISIRGRQTRVKTNQRAQERGHRYNPKRQQPAATVSDQLFTRQLVRLVRRQTPVYTQRVAQGYFIPLYTHRLSW